MDELGKKVVNVASVPHRSLFRYPGGKTWLVPYIRRWLRSLPRLPVSFAEPFAGGGIVSLSALFDGLVQKAVLVELDESIAAVWRVVLNGEATALSDRIAGFKVTYDNVRAVLDTPKESLLDEAFATIVRNRMQRGGIMSPGASLMKTGENGKGLLSRWYAATLCRRIRDLSQKRKSIQFIHGDGIKFLRANAKRAEMSYLIDPPYTVAGRRLYLHSEIDHEELFRVATKLRGDFLMTYDDAAEIRELAAKYSFQVEAVPMKNTHHEVMKELLVGRDFGWLTASSSQLLP
jgi:DNA adenine methylase